MHPASQILPISAPVSPRFALLSSSLAISHLRFSPFSHHSSDMLNFTVDMLLLAIRSCWWLPVFFFFKWLSVITICSWTCTKSRGEGEGRNSHRIVAKSLRQNWPGPIPWLCHVYTKFEQWLQPVNRSFLCEEPPHRGGDIVCNIQCISYYIHSIQIYCKYIYEQYASYSPEHLKCH